MKKIMPKAPKNSHKTKLLPKTCQKDASASKVSFNNVDLQRMSYACHVHWSPENEKNRVSWEQIENEKISNFTKRKK